MIPIEGEHVDLSSLSEPKICDKGITPSVTLICELSLANRVGEEEEWLEGVVR